MSHRTKFRLSRRTLLKAGAAIGVFPAPNVWAQTTEPLKIGFLTVLTGPLAAATLGGFGTVTSLGGQLWIQAKGVGFTIAWSAALSYAILKLLDLSIGLRVDAEQEQVGLDLSEHEERAYNL